VTDESTFVDSTNSTFFLAFYFQNLDIYMDIISIILILPTKKRYLLLSI